MPTRYIVMCRVSGGVTGTRQAPLKSAGVVQYFADRTEAELVAAKLNANPRPFAVATFSYWVEVANG